MSTNQHELPKQLFNGFFTMSRDYQINLSWKNKIRQPKSKGGSSVDELRKVYGLMQKCGFTDDVTAAKDYQRKELESVIINIYKAWYKKTFQGNRTSIMKEKDDDTKR